VQGIPSIFLNNYTPILLDFLHHELEYDSLRKILLPLLSPVCPDYKHQAAARLVVL
jgi:hypothetical protein